MRGRSRNNFSLILLGMLALALTLIFGLSSVWHGMLLAGLAALKAVGLTWDLTLNLVGIALIAIVMGGLLIPLETLGWWAGWYGDRGEMTTDPGTLEEEIPANTSVRRYVVYLDGISQAQSRYLPEVERFLDELAIALPDDIAIIRGLMPYSILNKPLTEDGLFSFFWRIADNFQMSASGGILGALIGATINIRNVLIVCVAADQRYGPIYNQGTAETLYSSLIHHGYRPRSTVPITLLGYSGGGQMAIGAAPYLKRSLQAPIEIVSLSGVISGNHNVLELEHLYHIVGDRDLVEKEGAILFPRRWKVAFLSYWNRAKQRGKISFISLASVGHNGATGPYSETAYLPDGCTHLQRTVEVISGIIQGNSPLAQHRVRHKLGNYDRYIEADFNRPAYYPLNQEVDGDLYRAIAPWMGRLILPESNQRRTLHGSVLFEVHHAPSQYEHLVGETVVLSWSREPATQAFVRAVTKDVHFSEDAEYSERQGCIHPTRLNHWRHVNPLESLAGAHPIDDMIVVLPEPLEVRGENDAGAVEIAIYREPLQITGRFYGLVKIVGRCPDSDSQLLTVDCFRVIHFNRSSRQFDGAEEVVRMPEVVFAHDYGSYPSTTRDIEKMPLNEWGWYIYGAKDAAGLFVVQAIAPRELRRVQPGETIVGKHAAWDYLKHHAWDVKGQKGTIKSVLLRPQRQEAERRESENCEGTDPLSTSRRPDSTFWSEGDRALLIHTYGGIGGKNREPAANTPIFFGHFAYGEAIVVHEPLANELMFDIRYHQVYTHNGDGIIAGTLAWNRYMGDRQVGWMGTRPVCDLLIKLESFTGDFNVYGEPYCVLNVLLSQLETMTARYRIGDGTGGTYVGPAHNCAQDSNQAMYTALKRVRSAVEQNPELLVEMQDEPGEAERFAQLVKLGQGIRWQLLPWGAARADWKKKGNTLGISPEEDFFQGLLQGLRSWRTLLPRAACEAIAKQFLEQGAEIWVLRTNQVGGYDPEIEPIAPTPLG